LQEENLFKAYLFFSAKWTKEQEQFINANKEKPVKDWTLPMMLPIAEVFCSPY